MINDFHKEYLDYIVGEVSETKPLNFVFNTKSKYFKCYEYEILLEVCGWRLFIKEEIWNNLQDFFGLTHTETKVILNRYFSEKLELKDMTPVVCTWHRQRGWY